jgi:hypothetical protein
VKNCVDNEGELVENYLNFIRELPMIHVNLIIIVIIRISEREKIGGNIFVPPLVTLRNTNSAVYILTSQPTGEPRFRLPAEGIGFSFSKASRPIWNPPSYLLNGYCGFCPIG